MAAGWNFTIDDSSSYLAFKPSEDTGLGNKTSFGWDPYWSASGGFLSDSSPNNYGHEASGQSLHITTLDGASVAFEFYGNAVYLFGNSNGTFDVAIDDNLFTNLTNIADGILYYQDDLTTGVHYVNLTAHFAQNAGQRLEFDYAEVTYEFSTGTKTPIEVVYNNTNTSALHYSDDWGTVSIQDAPSPTSSAPLHKTTFYGASASMSFTGEAVAVYGFRDYGSWLYNITLDEEPYLYNGSTIWELTNSLLFFRAGLDPIATHNIEIANDAHETYYKFYLNSVSVFKTNTTLAETLSTHHHTDTGAIVGGVIGGIGVLLLIFGLVIWLLRRGPSPYSDISPFTAEGSDKEQQGNTLPALSDTLPPVENAQRVQDSTRKRGAVVDSSAPAQVPESHPVSTSPRSGATNNMSQAGGTTAASATDAGTSTNAGSVFARAPSDAQPMIVDRIIALLAERIDRGTMPPDAEDAPPRYSDDAVL